MLQFTEDKFRDKHEITIGIEFAAKTIELNKKQVKIQIWDTAGHEAFQSITRTYYKGAVGALLVYDITNKQSFQHCENWLHELKENGDKDVTIMLVGNKCDLEKERQVSKEDAEKFAEMNGLIFLETSAKEAKNIFEVFKISAGKILNNILKTEEHISGNNSGKVKITNEGNNPNYKGNKNKKKCC